VPKIRKALFNDGSGAASTFASAGVEACVYIKSRKSYSAVRGACSRDSAL